MQSRANPNKTKAKNRYFTAPHLFAPYTDYYLNCAFGGAGDLNQ
jgi:hypothetical protein